jgi:hypothetical protein
VRFPLASLGAIELTLVGAMPSSLVGAIGLTRVGAMPADVRQCDYFFRLSRRSGLTRVGAIGSTVIGAVRRSGGLWCWCESQLRVRVIALELLIALVVSAASGVVEAKARVAESA